MTRDRVKAGHIHLIDMAGFFASPRQARGQEGMHSHYLFVHNIG
nr:MAG TPA: hypothetical protein [Caudoviricetes sp.]